MKNAKMSLDTIQGKLSRAEMKQINAGLAGENYLATCEDGFQTYVTTCDMSNLINLCFNHGGVGDCGPGVPSSGGGSGSGGSGSGGVLPNPV